MRILLVRHGESQANVDQKLHQTIPDHEIALSSRGQKQPEQAAKHITKFYKDKEGTGDSPILFTPYVKFINSPYRRTRDTADILKQKLIGKFTLSCSEDVLLCEQQFGLFDGLEDDEIEKKYPNEFHTWMLCKKYNGKFWARYPMGESPFDAAVRIHQAFGDVIRAKSDHIIVCHGTVVKLFVMMWFGYSPEWFNKERTIGNCGIYLIEHDRDKGWLFPGYKRGKLATRE